MFNIHLPSLLKYWSLVVVVWLSLQPAGAVAQIKYFDLTNPFLRQIPMSIPVFKAMTSSPAEADQVGVFADRLQDMLEFSGYFKMLDRASFIHDPQTSGIAEKSFDFGNWTTLGAELLITGGLEIKGDKMKVELRLFDTFKAKLLVSKRYRGKVRDQRSITRQFCSEVLFALNGNRGFFDSQLAFVSSGTGHKEIFTCDFDGANVKQLTDKRSITSFPSWSTDGNYLGFTSFVRGESQIYVLNLYTQAEIRFLYEGVQIAPNWVPNRMEITGSLTFEGDQDIYLLTHGGKMIKKLTNSRGIDVDATWSPDGRKMAFVSNRAGSPQIFIKEISTGSVHRLTFEGRYNTQPRWSPKGNLIAYSSMQQDQINIVVIDVEGNNPVQLTHNQGDNEAPSWSPDGSLIVFSSNREGISRIYVMTAIGSDQRRLLRLPGGQFQPSWSSNFHQ